jgi:hypothetical protein
MICCEHIESHLVLRKACLVTLLQGQDKGLLSTLQGCGIDVDFALQLAIGLGREYNVLLRNFIFDVV